MPISFQEKSKVFTIHTENSTYAFMIERLGLVTHLYYGERIYDESDLSYLTNAAAVGRPALYPEITYPEFEAGDAKYCPHARLQEYSGFGNGDYRTTSLQGRFADGSQTIDLRYHSNKIVECAAYLPGLHCVYANEGKKAHTLLLTLKDAA